MDLCLGRAGCISASSLSPRGGSEFRHLALLSARLSWGRRGNGRRSTTGPPLVRSLVFQSLSPRLLEPSEWLSEFCARPKSICGLLLPSSAFSAHALASTFSDPLYFASPFPMSCAESSWSKPSRTGFAPTFLYCAARPFQDRRQGP